MENSADEATTKLTRTLIAAGAGDRQAADQILPLVYDELRRLARVQLAQRPPGATIQPTALVHETYLKLVANGDPGWDCRAHFFRAAALAMRSVLVDQARRKASRKRGGDRRRVGWDDIELSDEQNGQDILALDEALSELEQEDERKGRIVMLHYFGGLTLEETARTLGISVPTVQREWRFTRSFLFNRLSGGKKSDPA
jgi:RNA polymerase sigma factor (TIGR02999 family)